ncbi:MAG: gliding motility-associated C-terminal domain-containing protein, partial [Bacteroidota bacterium]|nr:gliding motility-associated C-terminal domain-containing protein [Bacteroidota bacterium]
VVVAIGECTSATSSIGVQVKAPLAFPVITSPTLVCEGSSLTLTSNIPAGATVEWFGPNGYTSTEFSPVISPALPSDAGAYRVVYELNGCRSDTSVFINIAVQGTIASPQLTSDLTSICIGNPAEVTICIDPNSATPGATYTYLLNGNIFLANTDSCISITGDPLQGGDNLITVIASLQGCLSEVSSQLIIIGDAVSAQAADAGVNLAICPGELIVVEATDASPSAGVWTSSSPLVIFDTPTSPTSTVGPLPPGIYNLTWTLSFASCIDYSVDSIEVEIVPSPITFPDTVSVPFGLTEEFIVTLNDNITGIPYTLEIVDAPDKGNALHAGNGIFRYTPDIGFVGTDVMVYRICSTDCPDECSDAIVIIRVGNEDDCFVPTLFTPNADGINDVLIVPCIETSRFPDNNIIIFNEWGDAVFKAKPYFNDWDGSISGNPLPVGTYFYIMDFGDGSTPRKSFLILER